MDRAFLELQLAMAERKDKRQHARKPRIVGRPWWNFTLLAIVGAVALFVYHSPTGMQVADELQDVVQAGPEAVHSFQSSLDQLVAGRATGSGVKEAAKAKPAHKPKPAHHHKPPGHHNGSTPGAPVTSTTSPSHDTHTPARPGATVHSPPRVVLPAATAPPMSQLLDPSQLYYGLATPTAPFDMSAINSLTTEVGKSPNMLMYFQTWDTPFNSWAVQQSWRNGDLPVISWEPEMTAPGAVQPTLAAIANGSYDAWITQYAAAVHATGLPVGIRFAHEMNGDWYPWSEGLFGNKPGDYVRAWRHIHDIFTQEGATNAIWIWSPNIITPARPNFDFSSVYPGDQYVDWAALTGYFRHANATPTFDTTFNASLNVVRSITKKPILLSEIGAGTTEANRVAWINSLFQSLPSNPDVIGFIYFDENKLAEGKDDWRLESYPQVIQAFAQGIGSSRYG